MFVINNNERDGEDGDSDERNVDDGRDDDDDDDEHDNCDKHNDNDAGGWGGNLVKKLDNQGFQIF